MELAKKLLPKLSFKNPVDVYRMGWLGLAGTSVVYMLVILVRTGLGMDSSATQQARYTHSSSASQLAMRNNNYGRSQNSYAQRTHSYAQQKSAAQAYYANSQKNQVHRASDKTETRTARSPQEKIRLIRSQARSSNGNQLATSESKGTRATASNKVTAKSLPQKNRHADPAYTYMNQANYMQKFTYDLNDASYTKPVIKVVKARKVNHDIFGVRLAKGKSVVAIRNEWRKLKNKYKKPLRNLEPLIIKENNGDGYPIQLIVGPFSDSPSAVRFCASIYRRFNCNLKRYNGSPL